MTFVKDYGSCLCCLPLKIGVGLTSILLVLLGCVSLLAFISSDLVFQDAGYNSSFSYVPPIIGCLGLVFGVLGIFGTVDERAGWLYLMYYYIVVFILLTIMCFIADIWVLWDCTDGGSTSSDSTALAFLEDNDICFQGTVSYCIGMAIELLIFVYAGFKTKQYADQLDMSMNEPVDFGAERGDVDSRWKLYGVSDPNVEVPRNPVTVDKNGRVQYYGALHEKESVKQQYESSDFNLLSMTERL